MACEDQKSRKRRKQRSRHNTREVILFVVVGYSLGLSDISTSTMTGWGQGVAECVQW